LLFRQNRHRSVSPNLAMRMRIASAHDGAAILEDLYVAHPIDLLQLRELLAPHANHFADFLERHARNGEVMPRRKADDAADALLGVSHQQAGLVFSKDGDIGEQCGVVVVESKGTGELGISCAIGARIAWAQVAGRIVSGEVGRRVLYFAEPRAL